MLNASKESTPGRTAKDAIVYLAVAGAITDVAQQWRGHLPDVPLQPFYTPPGFIVVGAPSTTAL
eukprot:8678967-Alexandrium_andersonii.AAC.1